MPYNSLNNFILLSLFCLFFFSCTQSDDQQRFEDEAFNPPDGITEASSSGEVNPDAEDPDDWRISPMYQALITVEPAYAYPNPVAFNSFIHMNIVINAQDVVDRIVFLSFQFPDQPRATGIELDQSMLHQSVNPVSIPANSIAGGSGNTPGTYRILVLDGRENVITYGDVRVK